MKRASYREAIKLLDTIHGGEFEGDGSPDDEGLIGVVMISEIFDVPASKVVDDYVRAVARGAL